MDISGMEKCNLRRILDHNAAFNFETTSSFPVLSSIVCTIGPASRDVGILENMMEAGMTVARLNLSHGNHEYHKETIKNIRTAEQNYSKKTGVYCPIAIALDTRGREIRTGLMEGGGSAEVELKRGDTIQLTTDKVYEEKGNNKIIFVNYQNIYKVVKVGHRIFVDDGLISLLCKEVKEQSLYCTVENGGLLGSRKGINLPGVLVDLPLVSDVDKKDMQFAVEQDVDMIFVSFTANAQCVAEIRKALGDKGKRIQVVSKIENQQGLENLDEIIAVSDGIMVERGDLGSEIPIEKVFLAQKAIIAKCNEVGTPVICATQMLESMVTKPRPTRAEVSDVANAILDGADCVMLSGETAKGDYPVQCVETMARICREAEAVVWNRRLFEDLASKVPSPTEIVNTTAIAAGEASAEVEAAAVVVLTMTGKSAYLISRYRPRCPVIAITRDLKVARQAHLHRAVVPLLYEVDPLEDWLKDVDERLKFAIEIAKNKKYIKTGDQVVLVTGWKDGPGFTDTVRVTQV